MIIKKIAIGNRETCFIEDRLTKKLNIISSDDNNRGKTIVIQGALYALGNEPIFPDSFNYKDQYYYLLIELQNGNDFEICRKGNSFVTKFNNKINLFTGISELKTFLAEHLISFPIIFKDNKKKVVDPVLFYQLFFVGQDKKNTDSIFNKGYYKNEDFLNMLTSFYGIEPEEETDYDEENRKLKIKQLKERKKALLNANKILKKENLALSLLSKFSDKKEYESKLALVNEYKKSLLLLKNKRNKAMSFVVKYENVVEELKSLNHREHVGYLKCGKCGSTDIVFVNSENSEFDVSTQDLRDKFIESFNSKINSYNEEIEKINYEIMSTQEKLDKELSDFKDIPLEELIVVSSEFQNVNIDDELNSIENELLLLEKQQKTKVSNLQNKKQQINLLFNSLLNKMNEFLHLIDFSANDYKVIFTKRDTTFSGVEGPVFYFSKLYAFKKLFNHDFPIIVDYFRDGELSSDKENMLIQTFSELGNQIIFTATLKSQEYNKYADLKYVNNIDYSNVENRHLLSERRISEFLNILGRFNLNK